MADQWWEAGEAVRVFVSLTAEHMDDRPGILAAAEATGMRPKDHKEAYMASRLIYNLLVRIGTPGESVEQAWARMLKEGAAGLLDPGELAVGVTNKQSGPWWVNALAEIGASVVFGVVFVPLMAWLLMLVAGALHVRYGAGQHVSYWAAVWPAAVAGAIAYPGARRSRQSAR